MYQGAMQAIRDSLVHKGTAQGLTFTAELLPQRQTDGQMCVRSPCAKSSDLFPDALPHSAWRLSPKQDHLVCFLGGSLMLGATTTGATGATVSIPPKAGELTTVAEAEWKLGEEIIKTCMATHETAT